MKYVKTVSNDDLYMKGTGLVANIYNDYPVYQNIGVKNTRMFLVNEQDNFPIGTELTVEEMKNRQYPKLMDYDDAYLVMRVLYSVKLEPQTEYRALVVERINFPPSDFCVDYDQRHDLIRKLYPEDIIIRAQDDFAEYQPGEMVTFYDVNSNGRWAITKPTHSNPDIAPQASDATSSQISGTSHNERETSCSSQRDPLKTEEEIRERIQRDRWLGRID